MSTDYSGAENFILELLKERLPGGLTYHGLHHTLDVMNAAMAIAAAEKISVDELKLLRIAALIHDAGFIFTYGGHEEKGCEMARKILSQFGFDEEKVKIICGMIMATKLPQLPATQLEKIIADADLDYLGRNDFYPISETLFREFLEFGIVKDGKQWDEVQLKFLRNHHYHTSYCVQLREPEKQNRLHELEEANKQG